MHNVINSADSHIMEPSDLWLRRLPASMRDLGPRSTTEGDREVVYVDGKVLRRDPLAFIESIRPPGSHDPAERLKDLDDQGVCIEVMFPSLGMWCSLIDDRQLALACSEVYNDYLAEFVGTTARFVGVPTVPIVDIGDAVGEVGRLVDMGFRTIGLPAAPPVDRPYNLAEYEPLWEAIADTALPISMHVATGSNPVSNRGPGGAMINYLECRIPPLQTLSQLIGAGVLERYPQMHVVFTEGGATWLATIVEILDEGFHYTHPSYIRPALSMKPSEYIRRQVHATFQHECDVMGLVDVVGLESLMFGTDTTHPEGTWPHTQRTVDEIFANTTPEVRQAITFDNLTKVYGIDAAVYANAATGSTS
jgi:predicted TIM-barrel fold metal-dependent hydrolase